MLTWQDANVVQVLEAFDRGESVWSVVMGGLGPGYEQCIQLLVIELLRHGLKTPPIKGAPLSSWGEEAVQKLDEPCLGFTGAQVCAAKNLATRMLIYGYSQTLAEVKEHDEARLIQVSKHYPKVTV